MSCGDLFRFFSIDSAPTEIYTLSLHDALPIYHALAYLLRVREAEVLLAGHVAQHVGAVPADHRRADRDRKSTRLNSSHPSISYAVFCLKKKKNHDHT